MLSWLHIGKQRSHEKSKKCSVQAERDKRIEHMDRKKEEMPHQVASKKAKQTDISLYELVNPK